MKVSIITAVYNSVRTIRDCVASVRSQTYADKEHIIIDGGSTDGTLALVRSFPHVSHVVSEPDQGIYDAMNKGIRLATGDIVGILNADDVYVDSHVMGKVVATFASDVDAVFADLVYVRPDDLQRVVRYYRADRFTPEQFASGWMPPHPTFFVRRSVYERYGLFKTDYQIAADFELLARFLAHHRIAYRYIPEVIVKMRTGGVSTRGLASNLVLNQEILRACRENGIRTNIVRVYSKYLTKIFQLVRKPI
jgi:glycosyltransferase involved in cell wall biosynthesis